MKAPHGRLQWLSRIGGFCARHGGAIIFAWIIAFALGRGGAGGLSQLLARGASEIPGSESLRVERLLRTEFASAPADVLVFALRSPSLDRDPKALASLFRLLQARWESSGFVAYVVPETQFNDKRMVPSAGAGHIAIIGLKATNVHEAGNATPVVRAAVEPILVTALSWHPDLVWATTGHSALSYDLNRFSSEDTTRAELRALPLILFILVFAFGSLVAAGMPLALGLVSITVTLGIVYLVAHAVSLSDIVQNVVSMIGLSVGIDYSLFIIHRYRQELRRIEADHPAVVPADLRRMALEEAMGTAGSAVFFSGLTVLIGMGGLLFTPIVDLRSLGLGGGLAVAMALLASLTFLPALLSLLGPVLEWPAIVSRHLHGESSRQRWRTWADVVMRFPVAAACVSLAILLLLAWPGRHTRFGFPEGSFFPAELEFARGLELLRSMKLKGMLSPLHIVLTDSAGGHALTTERVPALLEFSARLRIDPRVAMIQGPVDLAADWPASRYEALYADVDAAWVQQPFARSSFISRDQTRILLHVLPKPESTLQDTEALAREMPTWMQIPGLRIELGGQPVYYNDFDVALKAAYGRCIGFVLLVTFVVLLLVFRAPLVAFKALLLNGLSVLAGYGMVVYVFQMGHGSGWLGVSAATEVVPLTVPLSMFCLLFGLSMDYEVFLLSRVREGFLRTDDNAASLREGLADTGAVITHAALIMVAVFGAFAFGRVVLVQMLGFGLAVAVLVDATVIRILLGPALMRLAGRWNWWPAGRAGGPDLSPGRATETSLWVERGAAISAHSARSRMSPVPLVAALAVLVLGVLAYWFLPTTGQTPGKEAWIPPGFVFADTRAKAERGDVDAQVRLGQMYAIGQDLPKDSAEAVKWYRKAADQGNADAQRSLGWMCANGVGVPKDGAEGAKWVRKAADQGNAKAQGLLGLMCANGEGVPMDSVEAVKWYRKAADQGNSDAQLSLGAMYANGDGVPKNGAAAAEWVRKAADHGNYWAQGLLDAAHFNGDGVPEDETEALAWCYIAAASGDETSVKARDAIERLLRSQMSLPAQPGSKETLKEIETRPGK